nr:unnamed protein product [Callosobruchus analis]
MIRFLDYWIETTPHTYVMILLRLRMTIASTLAQIKGWYCCYAAKELNTKKGLCNGNKLVISSMQSNVIEAKTFDERVFQERHFVGVK